MFENLPMHLMLQKIIVSHVRPDDFVEISSEQLEQTLERG